MAKRYLPDEPFPPYSYVPGKFPHPIRDPQGHSFGKVETPIPRPDAAAWRDCRTFLWGVDLFNAGYFWEAHEAWEQAWHACGRQGPEADFFKALIKLAAAGVKAREENDAGVGRHSRRAVELLDSVLKAAGTDQGAQVPAGQLASVSYFGLEPGALRNAAELLAQQATASAFLSAGLRLEPGAVR